MHVAYVHLLHFCNRKLLGSSDESYSAVLIRSQLAILYCVLQ